MLTIFGGALLVGTPALTANPFVIGAAFVVGGTTIVIGNVITVSLRQRITPARLLGSVNSGSASLVGAPCRSGPPLGVYSHSFSDSGPCSPSWRC
ncbi:MAG TPA: hypothetical protein VFC16_04890 [Nakamurella sp.]|nr:hypothetical protein [Nakamurella sp.]